MGFSVDKDITLVTNPKRTLQHITHSFNMD